MTLETWEYLQTLDDPTSDELEAIENERKPE